MNLLKRLQWKSQDQSNGHKRIKLSKIAEFSLFYTSFAPLWLSIIFIDTISLIENNNHLFTEKISIVTIVLFMILCSTILYLALIRSKKDTPAKILQQAKEEKALTTEYVLSYILPLFAFDFTTWNDVIIFLIFFTTLTFLSLKHNYFNVNIILELFGYKFYKCTIKNEDNIIIEQTIISKRELTVNLGCSLCLRYLNNEYAFDIV